MLKVLNIVSSESGVLCKRSPENRSCFCKVPLETMEEFEWAKYITELQNKAPTLLRLISTIVQHNDHRNATKHSDHHHPRIYMAVAVLMKERNREMCGIQSLITLLLFRGQAQKKVSQ